jgi:hypothetical protein
VTAPTVAKRPADLLREGRRAFGVPLLWFGAFAAGWGLVAVVDPNEPGHYPTCPLLAATGLYCPGCGTMRALHDLAHGDLGGAMARNPLAVLALPVLAWAWLAWVRGRCGTGTRSRTSVPAWVQWAAAVLVVLFGLVRNLPGMTLLSPA